MTMLQELAAFAAESTYDDLSTRAKRDLKIRVLDALACAFGALEGGPVVMLRRHLADFGGAGHSSMIGGGRTAPDRAAFYNGALVRFLDFNDSYLAPGETCHPSDNLGAVLAAAEYAQASGSDFLCALAVAYQVQCRLSDEAPVRARGFDHTTQGSFAVAAGVSRALGLDAEKTANAIAIAGTAFNALRVTRTGTLSHWKGLAYPNTAFGATHAAFLAMRGVTGPPEVFEGNKGFMESISGGFSLAWRKEDLERVTQTITKRFNAEVHSQTTLEGVLELREAHRFDPAAIRSVDIETFDVAHNIIGGGEEGPKTDIHTKEQADHSLPYMVAVALLDGEVMPEQYTPERITSPDVQALLRKVTVSPREDFSRSFPEEMRCRVRIALEDGGAFETEKQDYEGFRSRPMTWETALSKFERLAGPFTDSSERAEIVQAVQALEQTDVSALTELLSRAAVSAS